MSVPNGLPAHERLIWSSRGGGAAGYNQWAVTGFILYFLFGGGCSCFSLPVVLLMLDGDQILESLPGLAMSLVMGLPMLVALAWWGLPRVRASYFLTDKALLSRKLLGGFDRIELSSLTAAERYVAVYIGRYGQRREVHTHRAQIYTAERGNRPRLLGPIKDVDRLIELIQGGVLSRWFDLAMLPSLDGLPAPAEHRTDLFLCAKTKSEGFTYGPLFVGPTTIVRFTDDLPAYVLGRLYTVTGEASNGHEAERDVLELLENPDTGHYTRVPREGTGTQLEGTRLRLRHAEAEHIVDLDAKSAERFAGYLRVTTRAPDGR